MFYFLKFIFVVSKQYFEQKIYDVILKKTCGKYPKFDLMRTISILILRINYGNAPEEVLLVVSVVGISSIVVVVEVLVCVSICANSSHLGSCSWKTSGNSFKEYFSRLLIANVVYVLSLCFLLSVCFYFAFTFVLTQYLLVRNSGGNFCVITTRVKKSF